MYISAEVYILHRPLLNMTKIPRGKTVKIELKHTRSFSVAEHLDTAAVGHTGRIK